MRLKNAVGEQVPLVRRHGGNLVIVKLIDHEDLRLEWDDDHTEPNIDINYVKLHSATASLEGFRLDD